MVNKTDVTLQEVLSKASLMEAIKLPPWCVSVVVSFHYISWVVTMAAQLDEDVPIMSGPCPTMPEPEPHDSLVPSPSGVLTSPPTTSPPPMSSLLDIPLAGIPLVGCPFADLAIPSKGKWGHSPSDSSDHLHSNRTYITSPEFEAGSEHSSTQGNDHIPDLTPETVTGSRWQR